MISTLPKVGIQQRPLACAGLSVLLVLAWQALTVNVNYRGNWTGLFRIGQERTLPEPLAKFAFHNAHPDGYDGQYFLILAQDPSLRSGNTDFLDLAHYRSRRILVPALAWLLAGGRLELTPFTYIAIILASIFGGVFWLSRIMVARGGHAALGLLFLAVPATLIAIDSMTVDVILAALAACFVWQSAHGQTRALWLTLAAAGLVRETGLIFAAAAVIAELRQRHWPRAALFATAILPALAWYAYVNSAIPSKASFSEPAVPQWMLPQLVSGLLLRLLEPIDYPLLTPSLRLVARVLDALALLATAAGMVLGAVRLWRSRLTPANALLGLHILLALGLSNKYFWDSAYGFSRPLAPLFVLLFAEEISLSGLLIAFSISAFVDLRVLAEYQSQLAGIWRWLLT